MATTINASTTAGLIQTADTSGSLQLQTANVTAVTIDASQNTTLAGTLTVTGATTLNSSTVKSMTAQASTSGTFIDFTGIPTWAKRIVVMFSGVSTSGTSNIQLQIGLTTPETTGYSSYSSKLSTSATASTAVITSGFVIVSGVTSTDSFSGQAILNNLSGNTWTSSGVILGSVGAAQCVSSGVKTTTGTIDRIRITANGTDTFDAGTINIQYE